MSIIYDISGRYLLVSPAWYQLYMYYRKTSNISRTFVDNNIVDNSDVVGA